MAEWQLIETAPKDETAILGYDAADGKMTTIKWCPWGECWALVVAGSYADDDEWWPTHWMPLPDPPPKKEKED